MKINKLILWLLCLIVLIGTVQGDLCTDLSHYYSFETNVSDTHGNNHLTDSGTDDTAGKVGRARDFISANTDYLDSTTNTTLYDLVRNDFTISFWMSNNMSVTNSRILQFYDAVTDTGVSIVSDTGFNSVYLSVFVDGSELFTRYTNITVTANAWTFVVATWNSAATTGEIWLNNVSSPLTNHLTAVGFSTTSNVIGKRGDGNAATYLGGKIDEFAIWDRHLSDTEITQLYNTGSGLSYANVCTAIPPVYNFTVQANNTKTGTLINVFNITINGTTYLTTNGTIITGITNGEMFDVLIEAQNYSSNIYTSWNTSNNLIGNLTPYFKINASTIYNGSIINTFSALINGVTYGTTDGTIITGVVSNDTSFYDINITLNNYFNASYYGVNVSSNFEAKIIQSIIRINPYDIENNLLSLPFNLSTESYYNNSNILYLDAGSIPITFQKAGYTNQTQTKTITALMNTTLDITGIYQSVINITAKNMGGSGINDFSILLENAGYSNTINTTNGSAIFGVLNNNYNVTIDNGNYELKTVQINITGDYNYNFSLYESNSINFTFKDENTEQIINFLNVSMDIIGGINFTNITTDLGYYYISLLYPEEYTIRYFADGYTEKFFYFDLTNRTYNQVTLYLSNSTGISNISVTVYDEINNFVENVTVKAQKYDITTNTYRTVEMIKTNFEGEGILHLYKNTEYYKFILEYEGETKKVTTPTYIYGDSLEFQINLNDPIAQNFYSSEGIDYELTFNNVTNNFRYLFTDTANSISEGCLYVYTLNTGREKLLYNSSCVSGSSGTILIGVAAINGTTYEADAYVYFGSEEHFLSKYIKEFGRTVVGGQLGIFLIALLTIAFAFIGFWSVAVACVLAPLPLLFGSIIGIVSVPVYVTIPFVILGFIIAVVMSGRA